MAAWRRLVPADRHSSPSAAWLRTAPAVVAAGAGAVAVVSALGGRRGGRAARVGVAGAGSRDFRSNCKTVAARGSGDVSDGKIISIDNSDGTCSV